MVLGSRARRTQAASVPSGPPALPRRRISLPDFPEDLRGFLSVDEFDRASHTYGQAFVDTIRRLDGNFENAPDVVAYPSTEDELSRLLGFCNDAAIVVIPFGGGTSVVCGVEPPPRACAVACISVDMANFDRLLDVDYASHTALIQAGMTGPAIEAALKPHGLTLRFYPQVRNLRLL